MFKVLGQNLVNMEQKEQAKELMIPLGNTSTSTWYSHLITIIIITIITMFAIIITHHHQRHKGINHLNGGCRTF